MLAYLHDRLLRTLWTYALSGVGVPVMERLTSITQGVVGLPTAPIPVCTPDETGRAAVGAMGYRPTPGRPVGPVHMMSPFSGGTLSVQTAMDRRFRRCSLRGRARLIPAGGCGSCSLHAGLRSSRDHLAESRCPAVVGSKGPPRSTRPADVNREIDGGR